MYNKFEIVDKDTGEHYVSSNYDIFIHSNGVVEIYEPDEHYHAIVKLDDDEYNFYLL